MHILLIEFKKTLALNATVITLWFNARFDKTKGKRTYRPTPANGVSLASKTLFVKLMPL